MRGSRHDLFSKYELRYLLEWKLKSMLSEVERMDPDQRCRRRRHTHGPHLQVGDSIAGCELEANQGVH